MTEPLPRDRIVALYAAFGEAAFAGWDAWLARYTTHLQWADKLDAATLGVPENQQRLWNLKEVASAGASKNFSVEGVIGDPIFTGLLVDLKQHHWSPEPSRRAEELEAHFRTMLDLLRKLNAARAAAEATAAAETARR